MGSLCGSVFAPAAHCRAARRHRASPSRPPPASRLEARRRAGDHRELAEAEADAAERRRDLLLRVQLVARELVGPGGLGGGQPSSRPLPRFRTSVRTGDAIIESAARGVDATGVGAQQRGAPPRRGRRGKRGRRPSRCSLQPQNLRAKAVWRKFRMRTAVAAPLSLLALLLNGAGASFVDVAGAGRVRCRSRRALSPAAYSPGAALWVGTTMASILSGHWMHAMTADCIAVETLASLERCMRVANLETEIQVCEEAGDLRGAIAAYTALLALSATTAAEAVGGDERARALRRSCCSRARSASSPRARPTRRATSASARSSSRRSARARRGASLRRAARCARRQVGARDRGLAARGDGGAGARRRRRGGGRAGVRAPR